MTTFFIQQFWEAWSLSLMLSPPFLLVPGSSVSFNVYLFKIQLFWLLTRVAVCLQGQVLTADEGLLH